MLARSRPGAPRAAGAPRAPSRSLTHLARPAGQRRSRDSPVPAGSLREPAPPRSHFLLGGGAEARPGPPPRPHWDSAFSGCRRRPRAGLSPSRPSPLGRAPRGSRCLRAPRSASHRTGAAPPDGRGKQPNSGEEGFFPRVFSSTTRFWAFQKAAGNKHPSGRDQFQGI